MSDLTFKHAQQHQPWALPYARGVVRAADNGLVPHILASHCVLHAAKSVGKLAAVFEALDHPDYNSDEGPSYPSSVELQTIRDMSADLVTAALRFANLYDFDLATELDRRVREKNGKGYEP